MILEQFPVENIAIVCYEVRWGGGGKYDYNDYVCRDIHLSTAAICLIPYYPRYS